MKALLVGILALGTSVVSAQALTKAQFATLLQSKKVTLEAVSVGMSKSIVTTASVNLEDGRKCTYTQTSLQSVLKIEAEKMIVFSRENFAPESTPACVDGGLQAFQENVIFYEQKPSLKDDLEDLTASDVKSINKTGDIVTMTVNGTITNEDGTVANELVTVKYDITKSSFKNLLLSQSLSVTAQTTDAPDIDVNTVNLTDVVFCENNDADNSDCVRGDFSDILF